MFLTADSELQDQKCVCVPEGTASPLSKLKIRDSLYFKVSLLQSNYTLEY